MKELKCKLIQLFRIFYYMIFFQILNFFSKDVRLPVQLQRAMATEAEATREAKAKVITAQGEQRAATALRDAADVISESPVALQLRYLQTLTTISAEKNSTIIFPIPIEFASHFSKR